MEWLKNIRVAKKMSCKAIAEESGITQQYYNYIENGKRRPSVRVAKCIANTLGFDWTLFYSNLNDTSGSPSPAHEKGRPEGGEGRRAT